MSAFTYRHVSMRRLFGTGSRRSDWKPVHMARIRCGERKSLSSTRRLATFAPFSFCWGTQRWTVQSGILALNLRMPWPLLKLLKSNISGPPTRSALTGHSTCRHDAAVAAHFSVIRYDSNISTQANSQNANDTVFRCQRTNGSYLRIASVAKRKRQNRIQANHFGQFETGALVLIHVDAARTYGFQTKFSTKLVANLLLGSGPIDFRFAA
ncbi:hypothetical protein SAMN06265380_1301 [Ruegeria faecimaris]|uniref:Uncharacterized protein n=1 Tax=Ruegeria faecimaris TaxID=686389 RepID=A0A521FLY7_9RHOB|nr:hypothetical protein SAMN06265380_1301 [Ruegeria faecimaris]